MRVRPIYAWMTGASLLLLLLVIIQVTWLRKAAAMEENERNIHILRALERVEKQLSHGINCFEGYSKTYIPRGDHFYMMHELSDSLSGKHGYDTLTMFYDPADVYPENAILKEKIAHYKYPVMLEIELNFRLLMNESDSNSVNGSRTTNTPRTYRDIISNNLRIDELINTDRTDSLISKSLWDEHLSQASYGFGFISEQDGNIPFAKRIDDTAALIKSPYYVTLFRDNKFIRPYKLAVVFPVTPGIYGITWGLIVSIIIIVLLTIAFYLFIRLYVRQRRLSDMKHDFINNLTHEFNTPMANIALAIETLQQSDAMGSPKVHRIIDIIGVESARLRGNIERVLQVASLEKGQMKLHKTPTDLVQLIHQAIKPYEMQCEQLGGSIIFISPDKIIISADEVHLANSIGNLLENAIKYRRSEPVIHITVTSAHEVVKIEIADNGRGMSKENLKYVFDKFYRADEGDVHNTKGFGLGLNYVKAIIELHGGQIRLNSKEQEGTTFIINLPIKNDAGN